MSACSSCGTPMKPLFSGEFCPNECDWPESAAHQEYLKKLRDAVVKEMAEPKLIIQGWTGGWTGGWTTPTMPATPQATGYSPGPDDCPDPYCRAKGTKVSSQQTLVSQTWVPAVEHYKCNLCSKEWDVYLSGNQPGPSVPGTVN